ncbi:carbon-nitrogen hydrolase family protein [Paenibacillus ginsengihumi]|uniref:carbon-nitrogen hydrolase family protein n=1 Tax=Paenibacillus ginsengihumi TaxID=431596 RepID=UPI0003717BB0|nr:carbon-nitrogen hydrolase family protein [Paenibacillus ginsengihumi]
MKEIGIAMVQMRCDKTEIDRNLQSMQEYIEAARANGADFVCFPEMNITGYMDPAKHPHAALSRDHEAIRQVVEWSGRYAVCVIAGFAESNPAGKPHITQMAAHHGELLGFYRKRTIPADEADSFVAGDSDAGPVFNVEGLSFGLSICADIDDPQIFRSYARQGATIVFESAAPGLYGEQATRDWASGFAWWRGECMTKLRKYAAENSLYIAVATQAGRTIDEDFPGGGYLFDPQGRCIAETGDWSEGILYGRIAAGKEAP